MCKENPSLKYENDYSATSILRDFFHKEVAVFANTTIFNHLPSIEFKRTYSNFQEYFELFANDKKGALCGATADALASLYREFGLEATTYNFGEAPGSHVVTIVEINKERYIQDAFFNYTIIDTNYGLIPVKSILKTMDINTGRINSFLSSGIEEKDFQNDTRMTQLFLDPPENCLEKRIIKSGIISCSIPSRKLIDLNNDPRFLKPLKKAAPKLSNSSNPVKFLYLMRFPIGNDPEIRCEVAKADCERIFLEKALYKAKSALRSLRNYILSVF